MLCFLVNSDTILPSQMLVTSSLGLYLSKLPALFISTRSLALYHYCHLLCNSGMITHSFWNLHLLFLSGNVLSSALDKATSYLTPYENLGVSSPPLGNISSNLYQLPMCYPNQWTCKYTQTREFDKPTESLNWGCRGTACCWSS